MKRYMKSHFEAVPKSTANTIIATHYIDIDAETIYMICDEKLAELEQKILRLYEFVHLKSGLGRKYN